MGILKEVTLGLFDTIAHIRGHNLDTYYDQAWGTRIRVMKDNTSSDFFWKPFTTIDKVNEFIKAFKNTHFVDL